MDQDEHIVRPRWRRLAALILAPLIMSLYILSAASDDGMEGAKSLSTIFWEKFAIGMPLFYLYFAVASLPVLLAGRLWVPLKRARAVVPLFALTCAIIVLLLRLPEVRATEPVVFGVFSIPVSLIYCLVAGTRWRRI